ncbi:MAG: sensor histidine kinase, partial [Flavobacteriales bacterium]|nr:sensor histidine kinase [Flavobacteriales bacterium]
EMRYESERKERQITELQLNAAEQELLAVSSRNQRNMLIFFAVLLILGGVVITYRYIVQQRVSGLLKQKNKTIEEALQERELLIKEIHHRVKNNLQIVSSLLSIQGREIKDQKAMEAVKESKDRVQSMALIHQYLYGDSNLKSIDMPEYISELSHKLFSAYRLDRDRVSIHVHSHPVFLDVDTAIPVGIILNELITNSLKYAFPDGVGGELHISLKEKDGRLNLRVRDTGVGFDTLENSEFSFGMKLLHAFEKKLAASITIKSENGTDIIYSIGKYKTTWKKSIAS